MFLVCVTYPISEFAEARERKITKAAGRRWDRSSSDTSERRLEWTTEELAPAVALRKRLAGVTGITAVVREE